MGTKQALKGLKVVEFTWVVVGPYTSSYLGDFGAQVVKVESHTRPDGARLCGPFKGGVPSLNSSGYFNHQNSSKYGIALDLRKRKAQQLALKLTEWADVVIENMTPGAMGRLGLDYESVQKVNGDIIYVSTCLNGQTGPNKSDPGYGQMASAMAGLYHFSGLKERGPAPPEGAYIDYIAPRFAVISILAALEHRRRTGKGQFIDLAQLESGVQFAALGILDYKINGRLYPREGNRSAADAPHGAFPCKGDDRWVAVGVHNDGEWQSLCDVMGNPEWCRSPGFATSLGRKANEDELEARVGAWTSNQIAEDLTAKLQAAHVPSSPVESNRDLHEDLQLQHRGHFRKLKNDVMGEYLHDGRAFQLSKTPEAQFAAPLLGEHSEMILRDILKLTEEDIGDLYAESVITTEANLAL